jgi:hypothetical protein
MQNKKVHSPRESVGIILNNTSCFKEHSELNKKCKFEHCKYWIDASCDLNCTLIASQNGPKTLQEIGDIFGVTRMRICQIEKNIILKLKNKKNILT